MNDKKESSVASKFPSGSAASALLLAGALFLGPNATVRAQLTTGAGNEQAYSIGAFQLVVDPAFAFLFAPHAPSIYYYPGYSPSSGVLTSPVMYDFSDTVIGVSANHVRSASPSYFQVHVGTAALYPLYFPDSVAGYGSYAVIPPGFSFPAEPYGQDEIMTEIESFNLQTTIGSSTGLQCTNLVADPRVPNMPINFSMVVAGSDIPNLAPTQRSIGMVQEVGPGDFSPDPAQSFFNIYVEVTLPMASGNNTAYDFPPFSGNPVPPGYENGAVLYNDFNDPLVITNLDVTSLPPSAIYIHGVTTAVPMKFLFSNPPYWAANDVIGYLVLAGHGVISNNVDCAQIAAASSSVLDATFGPVSKPKDQMPLPWLRADESLPATNSSYVSVQNTVTTSSGTSVLDDTVSFVLPGLGTCYVKDLELTGLSNSITPPSPAGTSATYTASRTALSFQFSSNSATSGFTQENPSSTGSFQLAITNTGTTGTTTTYALGILGMSNSASSLFGTVHLRASPTKPSLGGHTIAPDPRGFRISSYLDVFLEASLDGVTWSPADTSMRLQAGMPPAAPGSMFISRTTNNQVQLNWQNCFVLQSATVVTGPYTDVSGASGPVAMGPYNVNIGSSQMFFRLRQILGFSQLQVLLPGESAAPGTATGKTGTPTTQTVGVPFNVTVNAVDSCWNIVNSSDAVQLTTTDGTATVPNNTSLVNGSAVLSMAFGSTGKFTVLATDVTDSSKLAGESSSVLSQP